MKYGVDLTYPPDRETAQQMRGQGWSWCGVYVGGPRAAARTSWHQADGSRYPVRDLADVFDGFLPIYVGRNHPWDSFDSAPYEAGLADGDDANGQTGACGFDGSTALCLDVEYGTYQSNPQGVREYVRGWVERVNAAGHPAVLYSDIYTLSQLGQPELVDYLWGAAWVRGSFTQQPPDGQFDPATPPPWHVWQYGGGLIAGVQVDVNSMVDSFPLAAYGG